MQSSFLPSCEKVGRRMEPSAFSIFATTFSISST